MNQSFYGSDVVHFAFDYQKRMITFDSQCFSSKSTIFQSCLDDFASSLAKQRIMCLAHDTTQ